MVGDLQVKVEFISLDSGEVHKMVMKLRELDQLVKFQNDGLVKIQVPEFYREK
jgi:hypothetical protein